LAFEAPILGIEKAIFGKPAPKKPSPGELAKAAPVAATSASAEPEPEAKPESVVETKTEIAPVPTNEENPSKA